jgi:hypothetical protein
VSKERFIAIKVKRGIHITSFLNYYPRKKPGKAGKTMKKQMVAMFDGVQPEAMKRELMKWRLFSYPLRCRYLPHGPHRALALPQ